MKPEKKKDTLSLKRLRRGSSFPAAALLLFPGAFHISPGEQRKEGKKVKVFGFFYKGYLCGIYRSRGVLLDVFYWKAQVKTKGAKSKKWGFGRNHADCLKNIKEAVDKIEGRW